MNNEKQRVLTHAERLALSLRGLVGRLERAVKDEDLATLAELQVPLNVWSIDQVRGAAWVLLHQEDV